MKTLPSSSLRAVRPALSTAGGSEGFLLSKIMIVSYLKSTSGDFELHAVESGEASYLEIIPPPDIKRGTVRYYFDSVDDVDWLIGQLAIIKENINNPSF